MEIYSRNQQIIDGELDENQVMMHIEKGKYFGLTPVGKRIWDLMEQPRSLDEITDALLSEYDVAKDQCEKEVQLFLEKAVQYNIIIKSEQHP
jgi:hypothetical protein